MALINEVIPVGNVLIITPDASREWYLYNEHASAEMRITLDGTTPSSTVGILLPPRAERRRDVRTWRAKETIKVWCGTTGAKISGEVL